MSQSNNVVHSISQTAKQNLLERLKQGISIVSKTGARIDGVSNGGKRKRKRSVMTTACGEDDIIAQTRHNGTLTGISATAVVVGDEVTKIPSLLNSIAQTCIRSRFIVGVNQCTRILEEALRNHPKVKLEAITNSTQTAQISKPLLLLLSKDSLRKPSSILDHITIYSRHLNIPTLILPGRASFELGHALGINCAAVVLILSSPSSQFTSKELMSEAKSINQNNEVTNDQGKEEKRLREEEDEWKDMNQEIDSFVTYAINKIPKIN